MRRVGWSGVLGVVCLVLVAAAPRAWASGEANSSYVSKLYRLSLSAGVRKIVDGESDYFESEEREFRARLGKAVDRVTRTVDGARARLGLVPYDPFTPELTGWVVEDVSGRGDKVESWHKEAVTRFLASGARKQVLVYAGVPLGKGLDQRITLAFCVNRRVKRSELDAVAREVASLVPREQTDGREPKDPATLKAVDPVTLKHPGLELVVRPEARFADARAASAVEAQLTAFGKQLEARIVQELAAVPELGLPSGWPDAETAPWEKGKPALQLGFHGGPRSVTVQVPLPAEVPDALREKLRKRVASFVYPEAP